MLLTFHIFLFGLFQILEGLEAEPIRHELSVWKENFVNIQDLMDEYTQLKERSQLLRDEVCGCWEDSAQIILSRY